MTAVLRVIDERPGSRKEPQQVCELRIVSEKTTARELIRRRMVREVLFDDRQVETLDHGQRSRGMNA